MTVTDQHQVMATLILANAPPPAPTGHEAQWAPTGGLAPVKNIKTPCLCQKINLHSFSPLSLLVTIVTELSQLLDSPVYQPNVKCHQIHFMLPNTSYMHQSYTICGTICFHIIMLTVFTGYQSKCRDLLRAGWSGDRIPVGRDFLCLSRPAPKLSQPPVQWVPGLSRG